MLAGLIARKGSGPVSHPFDRYRRIRSFSPAFCPETAFWASLSLIPSDFCNPSGERESLRMPLGGSRLRGLERGFGSQSE